MSSDLEKLLRDARESLPEPMDTATQRARSWSLATLGRKRTRTRVLVLVAATLVSAVALGVTAGSLNAPSVTAAREPAVLGFVPEPGWFALQSPPPAIEGQQTAAVAANVPFASDDVVNGLVEPSGLPYSTLLSLPPKGIVIVMTMTPPAEPYAAPVPVNPTYPDRELPLSVRDGVPYLQWGAQVRPDQPLAQYQLRAKLAGYNVDILVYFGASRPSTAQIRAAQHQLEGLVMRKQGVPVAMTGPAEAAASVAVIDRTYACSTVILGGLYQIEARAHAGRRRGSQWSKLPYAVVSTGGWAGTLIGNPYARENSLAWITAGTPSRDTTADLEGETFPVQSGGTLGVNKELCKPSRAALPLRSAGLRGGSAGGRGEAFDCDSPRQVVLRLKATVLSNAAFRERANVFLASNVVVRRAELAVRTHAGRLLGYAEVSESGQARLFIAKGCTRE